MRGCTLAHTAHYGAPSDRRGGVVALGNRGIYVDYGKFDAGPRFPIACRYEIVGIGKKCGTASQLVTFQRTAAAQRACCPTRARFGLNLGLLNSALRARSCPCGYGQSR